MIPATFQSRLWPGLSSFNIPACVIEPKLSINPSALTVLLVLCHLAKKPDTAGEFASTVSQEKLQRYTGLSKASVINAIKTLKSERFITTSSRQKGGLTRYSLLNPETADVLSATKDKRSVYWANRIRYLTLPSAFVTQPEQPWSLANLTSSELAVYTCAAWEANQKRRNDVPFSLDSIAVRSAVDKRTLCNAIDGLEAKELIHIKGDNTLLLCDPRTGFPFADASDRDIENIDNYRVGIRKIAINTAWSEGEVERLIESCVPGAVITRVGDNLRIACVFHPETVPSLDFSLRMPVFHCLGCNAKGNFRQFYQRMKGLKTSAETIPSLAAFRGASYREPTNLAGAEAVYTYRDADGNSIKRKIRRAGKKFKWERRDSAGWQVTLAENTPKLLYHLPQVIRATTVILTEGEKDCDRLSNEWLHDPRNYSRVAVTTMGSTAEWQDAFGDSLKNKRVIVMLDNDKSGRECSEKIAASLSKRHIEHSVVQLPSGSKDVSIFLDAHNGEELAKLIGPEWIAQRTFTEATTKVTEF